MAYGLELRSLLREQIKRKVTEALRLVHLDDLGERYPSEISGGQQQRVALARAIVVEPCSGGRGRRSSRDSSE